MIAWALSLMLGAMQFSAQDTAGLRIGPIHVLDGSVAINALAADLNADGAQDLVFAQEVAFQQDGAFPSNKRTALPDVPDNTQAAVWKGELFMRWPGNLAVFRWNGETWQNRLRQSIDWPASAMPPNRLAGLATRPVKTIQFERFLCDLDRDGTAEIVAVCEDNVYLYRIQGEQYAETVQWPVIPPPLLDQPIRQTVWPENQRVLAFPSRQIACRLLINPQSIDIIVRNDAAPPAQYQGPGICYHITSYTLDPATRWRASVQSPDGQTTRSLPDFLRPCRLNKDERIDYAGGQWVTAETSALPRVIYETWATLDGGESFQIRRGTVWPNYRTLCSFIDFDHDGDSDMAVESTPFFDKGLRESISGFLTQTEIEHVLSFYKQTQGQFSKEPDFKLSISIQIGQPAVRAGERFLRYLAGELLNFTGDFNGDGYRDLLVHDKPGQLSIYLGTNFGFQPLSETKISMNPSASFAVADIDGDKRSDIIVQSTQTEGTVTDERTQILFSREASP